MTVSKEQSQRDCRKTMDLGQTSIRQDRRWSQQRNGEDMTLKNFHPQHWCRSTLGSLQTPYQQWIPILALYGLKTSGQLTTTSSISRNKTLITLTRPHNFISPIVEDKIPAETHTLLSRQVWTRPSAFPPTRFPCILLIFPLIINAS